MAHNHSEDYTKELESASKVSIALNFLFVIIEIVGGLYTNSIALLSDAIHDFSDVITLSTSYVLIKVSKKDESKYFNFGLKGAITVGAIINTLIILISSIFILTKAVNRIINPEEVDAQVVLLIAIFGVIINGISVFKFRNQTNIMSRSIVLHLLEDALGWVAVLASSILMIIFENSTFDSILSLGISLFLIVTSLRNMFNIINVILYKVPDGIDVEVLKEKIKNIPNVLKINDFKVWSLEGETTYSISKLKVNKDLTLEEVENIKEEVNEILHEDNIKNNTIEFSI